MKRARKDSAGFARCLKSKWLVDFVKLSGIMVLELSTLHTEVCGEACHPQLPLPQQILPGEGIP